MGHINNIHALVQVMAWRRPGDKPLSESMMVKRIYASLGSNELMWSPNDKQNFHIPTPKR